MSNGHLASNPKNPIFGYPGCFHVWFVVACLNREPGGLAYPKYLELDLETRCRWKALNERIICNITIPVGRISYTDDLFDFYTTYVNDF